MLDTMIICPNGHYYDSTRYRECPYCKPGTSGVQQLNRSGVDAPPSNVTVPVNNVQRTGSSSNMEKTVRLVEQKAGYDPVVGWLVCVEGSDKGKDFRLHDGNNFVGRSSDMDISLAGDKSVSASNHFSITYDRRHDRYFMSMGMGKEIVYVNNEPLTANARYVKIGDRIEVGGTTLVFIPLSKEYAQWTWEE